MTFVDNNKIVNLASGISFLIFTIFMLIIIRPLNKFTKERIALYILFFKVFLNFYRKRFDSRPELFRYFDCLLSIFEVFLSIWTFWWYFRLVIFEIFQKFELFFWPLEGFFCSHCLHMYVVYQVVMLGYPNSRIGKFSRVFGLPKWLYRLLKIEESYRYRLCFIIITPPRFFEFEHDLKD